MLYTLSPGGPVLPGGPGGPSMYPVGRPLLSGTITPAARTASPFSPLSPLPPYITGPHTDRPHTLLDGRAETHQHGRWQMTARHCHSVKFLSVHIDITSPQKTQHADIFVRSNSETVARLFTSIHVNLAQIHSPSLVVSYRHVNSTMTTG